jgi:predicted type IV restriction endonuclease
MPAPQIIIDLIERFERNLDDYKSGSYNETQVRHEFIDPFFEALGWDVNNQAGNAEAYKDVIHEDAVKVGGITKAPDYSFRIGGAIALFFAVMLFIMTICNAIIFSHRLSH